MAYQATGMFNDAGKPLWYDPATGNYTDVDPTVSGQYQSGTSFNEGSSNPQVTDAATGRVVTDQGELNTASAQFTKEADEKFLSIWNNPNADGWSKVRAAEERYGIHAVQQAMESGQLAHLGLDPTQLGDYVRGQRNTAEDKGFSINGNPLGLWPVAIGTGLFAGLAGAGAASAEGAAAGSTAAEGTAAGVSASAGPEFTGGLTGTVSGSPGLAAGSFNSAGLGAGGASAVPGLTAPAGVTGAGALSAGSFVGESIYPVLGGASAATGATGLGSSSAGSVAPTTAAAGGGTALSRVLGGNGSGADWASIVGTLGATGLGIYGAGQHADALRDIANQARADRAPFLNASTGWLANPDSYWQGPGKTALDANLRALSANGAGNPIDQPTSLGIATQAGLADWRNAVTGFGNLGLAGEDSRNNLMAGAAGAENGIYNSLGYGLSQLTNPPTNLETLLRQMRGSGGWLA
jgi:hypothetical protein